MDKNTILFYINNKPVDFETFLSLLEEYIYDEVLFEKTIERLLFKNKCHKTLNKLFSFAKAEDLKYLVQTIRNSFK